MIQLSFDRHLLEQAWLKHIGFDQPQFPRVLVPPYAAETIDGDKRPRVFNELQYIDRIWASFGKYNLYTGVYADFYRKENLFNKIYIDFDAEEELEKCKSDSDYVSLMDYVYQEVLGFSAILQETYGYLPRCYFSGSKGFSVYIDIPMTKLIHRESLREFVLGIAIGENDIEKGLIANSVRFVDTSVLGDKSRVSRIPFTPNVNLVGCDDYIEPIRLCVPIDFDMDIQEILDKARYSDLEYPEYDLAYKIPEKLVEIDKEMEKKAVEIANIPMVARPELCTDLVKLLENASNITDGRKTIIHFAIVPRLIETYGVEAVKRNPNLVISFVRDFINRTPPNREKWEVYERHARQGIERTIQGDASGKPWMHWDWDTLLMKNPRLITIFTKKGDKRSVCGKSNSEGNDGRSVVQ